MSAGRLASLRGRRVLVTRAAGQAASLSAGLIACGAEPVEVPLIEIQPAAGATEIRAAVARLRGHAGPRWVVFTSANAVRQVARALEHPHDLGTSRVVAIGGRTAAALTGWGRKPDLIPQTASSVGTAAEMIRHGVSGAAVWLPRGDLADEACIRALRAAGADVQAQVVYRTVIPAGAARGLAAAGRLDAITLTSDSTVDNLLVALEGRPVPPGVIVACLGPVTAAAAVAAGLRVDAVAAAPNGDSLLSALADAFRGPSDGPQPLP